MRIIPLPPPGDFVSFSIDTSRNLTLSPEQQAEGEGPPVLVQLGFLSSYEHMGIGVARCV